MKFKNVKEFLEWFFQNDFNWNGNMVSVLVTFEQDAMHISGEGWLGKTSVEDVVYGSFTKNTFLLYWNCQNNWYFRIELEDGIELCRTYRFKIPTKFEDVSNDIIDL